jgi:hypothetical protein
VGGKEAKLVEKNWRGREGLKEEGKEEEREREGRSAGLEWEEVQRR